jgi:hypothetical protein
MFAIDSNLINRVREARLNEGLEVPNVLPADAFDDHCGYVVYDKATGKKYTTSHFFKYWYNGWCIVCVLEHVDAQGHADFIRVIWESYMSKTLLESDGMAELFSTEPPVVLM